MPIFKGTFIFGQCKNGWSESIYIEATDYTAAATRLRSIASFRAKLLGKGSNIEGVRISDEAVLNDAFPVDIGEITPTQDATTDTPWNSIYVRAQAGALYRRQFHLRGVPDSWIEIDPVTMRSKIPATARQAFQAWADSLTKGTPVAKMKVATKSTAAVKVTGAPQADAAFTKINVGTVAGLDATPYILMRNWKGVDKKTLNRRWDVISYTAPWLTISLPFAYLADPTHAYGGVILQRVPGYADMTDLLIVRYAAKRTGRAFFVSPGRTTPATPQQNSQMLGITVAG